MTLEVGPDRLDGYEIPAGSWDEGVGPDGTPRPHAARVLAALTRMGARRLQATETRRDAIFMPQGITFEIPGDDGERRDRAWAPLRRYPIKGVDREAARAELQASVTMTPLGGVDPAAIARA